MAARSISTNQHFCFGKAFTSKKKNAHYSFRLTRLISFRIENILESDGKLFLILEEMALLLYRPMKSRREGAGAYQGVVSFTKRREAKSDFN